MMDGVNQGCCKYVVKFLIILKCVLTLVQLKGGVCWKKGLSPMH